MKQKIPLKNEEIEKDEEEIRDDISQQNLEKNESKIDIHLNIKEIMDTEKTYGLYQLKMLTFKFLIVQ